MKENKENGLEWFEFQIFQPYSERVSHGCFTRLGGVSKPPFDALNVSFSVGDVHDDVMENRLKICAHFNQNSSKLFDLDQVHGTQSVVAHSNPTSKIQADILLTNTKGNILMVKHADCQAALIYDPVHHVAGAVHSGWRGLVQKAYSAALSEMNRLWKTDPDDVVVGISPSLCLCHSEFKSYQEEFPEELWRFCTQDCKMNLVAIAQHEFIQAGVPKKHIEALPLCTFEKKELFFSYRREHVTGRCATCIQLL